MTTPDVGRAMLDANVVATMLVQGIDTLVTDNVDGFVRYADLVRVLDLRG